MNLVNTRSYNSYRYIEDGIAQNFRNDGRGRFDFRPFILETGIISQTNGSARYVLATVVFYEVYKMTRLKLSSTDILVGIKAEIGEPLPNAHDQGVIQVSVEW